jgi:small subunit ribosomal protein S20
MANTKSAKKKTRVILRRAAINRVRLGKYRGAIKSIENAIQSGKKSEALKIFNSFQSVLMKVSKKGSIKRQTASRKISRIAKKISAMK